MRCLLDEAFRKFRFGVCQTCLCARSKYLKIACLDCFLYGYWRNLVVFVTQVMQHQSECPEVPDLGGFKLTIVVPRRLQGMASLESSRMLSLTRYRNLLLCCLVVADRIVTNHRQ
jgi:hypothetical protein